MKTYNIRLGHACNSSSSHSIVPLAGGARDDYERGEFGWQSFWLASPKAKLEYLAATLSVRNMAPAKITELTGVEPLMSDDGWGPFGYVDHQSVLALPIEGPHADEFIRDLAEYLKRNDVVILGGNDNSGVDWKPVNADLPIDREASPVKLRPGVAPNGKRYWTVMNRRRGDRVRFSFHDQPLQESNWYSERPGVQPELDLPYATAPELVDMKVTGYCPFEKDCPWCYMGSTRDGGHAARDLAFAWLDAFAEAGVFEIALGGGEPTLWPHLREFIGAAQRREINVNLTTKNIAWLKPGALAGLSAIAVSLNNRRDLDRLAHVNLEEIRETPPGREYASTEITVQCVPAFCDDDLLRDIVAYAKQHRLRVTFLGVKRTGRAAEERRQDDLRWLEALSPYRGDYWLVRGVAVDTLMADASREAFQALDVDPVWYETTEGRFSCFVDATAGKVGVSSYVPADALQDATPRRFLDSFQAAQRFAGIRPDGI